MAVWGIDLGVRSIHLAKLDGDLTVRTLSVPRTDRWKEIHGLILALVESDLRFKQGDRVFIEEPPMVRSQRVHGEMHQLAGLMLFLPLPAQSYLVNVKTWKKELLGNGNAGKPAIRQWLNDHYSGYSAICAEDQDLIDATCVALHGQQVLQRLGDLDLS